MFEQKFVVGGEFTFSPKLIFQRKQNQFSNYGHKLTNYHRYYTFGAYYSIVAIIRELKFDSNQYVLLPSYLCPSMIEPFRKAGVKYEFYKLHEGLYPDLKDIEIKMNNNLKAVLFIDYFGFSRMNYLTEIVSYFRQKGIMVLQDMVQSWLNCEDDIYGDFCFNSLRKYSPFEASILFSKNEMSYKVNSCRNRSFLFHKRYAQILRYLHIKYGLLDPNSFLKHIEHAKKVYYQEGILGMPVTNRYLLDRIDFETIGHNRENVYHKIIKEVNPSRVIKDEMAGTIPMAMPVYLNDRDAKKKKLHNKNIHCPIHWKLDEEIDKKEHEYSWDLQNHELTLPINVKWSDTSLYIDILKEVL